MQIAPRQPVPADDLSRSSTSPTPTPTPRASPSPSPSSFRPPKPPALSRTAQRHAAARAPRAPCRGQPVRLISQLARPRCRTRRNRPRMLDLDPSRLADEAERRSVTPTKLLTPESVTVAVTPPRSPELAAMRTMAAATTRRGAPWLVGRCARCDAATARACRALLAVERCDGARREVPHARARTLAAQEMVRSAAREGTMCTLAALRNDAHRCGVARRAVAAPRRSQGVGVRGSDCPLERAAQASGRRPAFYAFRSRLSSSASLRLAPCMPVHPAQRGQHRRTAHAKRRRTHLLVCSPTSSRHSLVPADAVFATPRAPSSPGIDVRARHRSSSLALPGFAVRRP